MLTIVGRDVVKKARRAGESILERLREMGVGRFCIHFAVPREELFGDLGLCGGGRQQCLPSLFMQLGNLHIALMKTDASTSRRKSSKNLASNTMAHGT